MGSVVLFSSGNNNQDVIFPARLENVIAVGASSFCDERKSFTSCDNEDWWGSNFGESLDLVAPGVEIWTTDISGANGYTLEDDEPDFNGTSSACPNAAGVVALILSVNPELTQQEAREILERSTDKIDGYNYSITQGQPHGSWNSEVGYGRVNAFAAVQMAQQFTNAELEGVDLVCYNGSTTISLTGNQDPVTWQASSNVTIQSSDNSSITVRASSSNATGNGWVRATLSNGVTLQEDFEVGAPSARSINLDSFRSVNLYSDRWTNITATYNHVIDIGQLGYDWHWYASPAQMRDDGISYIHVKPINSANRVWIRVQAENECGCSDWVGKWFDVVQVSSNCRDCPTDGDEIHY